MVAPPWELKPHLYSRLFEGENVVLSNIHSCNPYETHPLTFKFASDLQPWLPLE